jgi:hypothetical protein
MPGCQMVGWLRAAGDSPCLVVRWLDRREPRETLHAWLSDGWIGESREGTPPAWLSDGWMDESRGRLPLLGCQMVGWLIAVGDSPCLVVRWLDG